ncbi:uncharacterized protein LOC144675369 isoform X1 [Cetorhinus maximus]
MLSRSVLCCVLLVLLGSWLTAAGRGKMHSRKSSDPWGSHSRHDRSVGGFSSPDSHSLDEGSFSSLYDYGDFLLAPGRRVRSANSGKRSDVQKSDHHDSDHE